jgi:biotin operon repressor
MYEETKAKIRESAQLIWALWQQGLRPDTEPPYSTALKLLDEIDGTPLGLEDLAEALDLHTNTVSEYINALKQGGVPIKVSGARSKGQITGRQEARYWIES